MSYNFRTKQLSTNFYLREFSFPELVVFSKQGNEKFPNARWNSGSNRSFYGSPSFAETIKRAEYGNDVVTERVKKLVECISGEFSFSSTSDYMMDITGQTLDVGTLLTGNPECWLQPIEIKTLKSDKLIDISTEYSFSGGTDIEDIEFRGALIASLIDALRQRGFSVRVCVTHSCTTPGYSYADGKVYAGFTIKTNLINYGELPDLSKIAFYMADASLYRQMIFAAKDMITGEINTATKCYASDAPIEYRGKYHIDANDGLYSAGYVSEALITKGKQWLETKLTEISEAY